MSEQACSRAEGGVLVKLRPTPSLRAGQCGSCWSFSTTGSVESAWAIAPGNALVSLSEQQLVSCDNTTNDGCDGGWPYAAVDWLAVTGADTEESYPYVSGGGTAPPCSSSGHVKAPTNVTGWRLVPGNTTAAVETALAAWLAAYGPVSILVDASELGWLAFHHRVVPLPVAAPRACSDAALVALHWRRNDGLVRDL